MAGNPGRAHWVHFKKSHYCLQNRLILQDRDHDLLWRSNFSKLWVLAEHFSCQIQHHIVHWFNITKSFWKHQDSFYSFIEPGMHMPWSSNKIRGNTRKFNTFWSFPASFDKFPLENVNFYAFLSPKRVNKIIHRNAFHLPPHPCLLFLHLSGVPGHSGPHTNWGMLAEPGTAALCCT